MNDHLVLISGATSTGKSACLRNLKDPENVVYMNAEGKRLPFKAKFNELKITDPLQVPTTIVDIDQDPATHTIVVDTATYLMDMFESLHVRGAANTMQAWGDYGQYFRDLMLQTVSNSPKQIIFLAHTLETIDDKGLKTVQVPVKGALKNNGIESYFSIVVATKRVPIKVLKSEDENGKRLFDSPLLTFTPQEESLGFKYVFQTALTADTIGERIRAPMGMWEPEETYIDNDAQLVLDRLNEFYI